MYEVSYLMFKLNMSASGKNLFKNAFVSLAHVDIDTSSISLNHVVTYPIRENGTTSSVYLVERYLDIVCLTHPSKVF